MFSATAIPSQGRFITAIFIFHGGVLTGELKGLMNLKFTMTTGNEAMSSQKAPSHSSR